MEDRPAEDPLTHEITTRLLGGVARLRCASCKKGYPEKDWREMAVLCETCGEHSGLYCPGCGAVTDLIFDEPVEYIGFEDE